MKDTQPKVAYCTAPIRALPPVDTEKAAFRPSCATAGSTRANRVRVIKLSFDHSGPRD